MNKNNYFLFIDESGHHGLKAINQEFPILLLCGCIFEEEYYLNEFEKKCNQLKKKYFNTTDIILHSRDIRKWQKEFKVLGDPKLRNEFYKDLDNLIKESDFTIVASAILKDKLIDSYGPHSDSPYELSLTFILERTVFLTDNLNCNKVKVVAEARGKKEDSKLHDQYQITMSHGTNYVNSQRLQRKFENIEFVKKSENVLGTQLCDLVAYPIATKVLYPDRENLAFRLVESKIYRQFPNGDYLGYGLKIFP